MPLGWLFGRFREHESDEAIVWRDRSYTYGQLLADIDDASEFVRKHQIGPGSIVLLDADFSPSAIALLLACVHQRCIVVPVAAHVANLDRDRYAEIAQATHGIAVADDDTYGCRNYPHTPTHELLAKLRSSAAPGLVLFSSGSTGDPKATLHDMTRVLQRFREPRHSQRMITFLLFDHIGGFNTLMYTLSNHGCVITLEARDPVAVCRAIETHRAEVLPTSPTFLNLLLMSGEHETHDLSSLRVINYATEVMPAATLARLHAAFPNVTIHQSYGLSELGIMRTKSRSSDSLWIKLGGAGYETRVVDGILHIRTESSMLGYLNAESPIDADGWFNTEDEIEVDGEWIRFKGRKSDIINVGGEKVYPAEVESVIMEVDGVTDATVTKEAHPITGNIVVADVRVAPEMDERETFRAIRRHCYAKLERFKVPVKMTSAKTSRISDRFKKQR